jgi:hypothetical protein
MSRIARLTPFESFAIVYKCLSHKTPSEIGVQPLLQYLFPPLEYDPPGEGMELVRQKADARNIDGTLFRARRCSTGLSGDEDTLLVRFVLARWSSCRRFRITENGLRLRTHFAKPRADPADPRDPVSFGV